MNAWWYLSYMKSCIIGYVKYEGVGPIPHLKKSFDMGISIKWAYMREETLGGVLGVDIAIHLH